MFAVFKTGGKQYRVAADDELEIEKIDGAVGDVVTFGEVLMVGGEDGPMIGAPLVEGASVAAEVLAQARHKKVMIFKKRRRQNSRRRNGHRQSFTAVRISEILTDGKAPSKKAASKPAASADAAVAEATESAPAEAKPSRSKSAEAGAVPAKDKPAKAEAAAAKPDAPAPLFETPEGDRDDLKKITGVGPVLEKKLNALGVTQYRQIAAFTAEDIKRVDEELKFHGRIERDNWLEQARTLAEKS